MSLRTAPASAETECAVIGSIMLNPTVSVGEAIAFGMEPDWFYDLRWRHVFELIVEMVEAGVPVDLVTMVERMKSSQDLRGVEPSLLLTAMNASPSAANLTYYAKTLKDLAFRRKIIQVCTEVAEVCYEPGSMIESVVETAELRILAINQGAVKNEIKSMKDLVVSVSNRVESRNGGQYEGLGTGFSDLDKYTSGGMKNGEMWVVAARPNQGKSAIVMNIAQHVAAQFLKEWADEVNPVPGQVYDGKHVVVFSLEMMAEDIVERCVSSTARINTRITQGGLLNRDLPALAKASREVARLPLIVDDTSPLSVSGIRARARRYHAKRRARLVVVDYLQLAAQEAGSRDSDRRVSVDNMSRGLKSMAKELEVPVLVVSQLNREYERQGGRKPRLSDLRESGAIEQDADLVAFLYSPVDPEEQVELPPDQPRPVRLLIAKQRNGPRDVDVDLVFFPSIVRFESGARGSRVAA